MRNRLLKSVRLVLGIAVFGVCLIGSARALQARNGMVKCFDDGGTCIDVSCTESQGHCDDTCFCQL